MIVSKSNFCFRSTHKWACQWKLCQTAYEDQTVEFLKNLTIEDDDRAFTVGKCGQVYKTYFCYKNIMKFPKFDFNLKCTKLRPKLVNELCNQRKIIAIKTTRLCEISHIAQLQKEIPDLKIIISYRDPRAIYRSRQQVPFDTKVDELLPSVSFFIITYRLEML